MVAISSRYVRLQTKVQGNLQALLIDSGESDNFLSLATRRRCSLDVKQRSAIKVKLVGSLHAKTRCQVKVELQIGIKVCIKTTFEVVDLEVEGILGMTFLKQFNSETDWTTDTTTIDG